MQETPLVSGREILSYTGDAGLGYSGTGVAYEGNPADLRPFSGMQSTIDRIQQNDFHAQMQKHLEDKQKDEEMYAMLSSMKGKGSIFNMKGPDGSNMSFSPLPQDQQILNEKADEIRRYVLKNPRNYKNDPDFYKKQQDYENLLSHAQYRSSRDAQDRINASQSINPEDREGYLQSIKTNIEGHKLTDFHRGDLYMPKQTIDPNAILAQDLVKDKNNYVTYGTKVETVDGTDVEKSVIGLKDNVADVRPLLVPGSKGYVEALKMSQSFMKNIANNPQAVTQMNATIDEYNKQRGYTPGSPHYQPKVAEVDAQGQVGMLSTDPVQIAGALFFEKYGGLQTTEKATDILSKKANTASQIADRQADNARQNKQLNAQIKHWEAEDAARSGKPQTEAQIKEDRDKKAAQNAIIEARGAFNWIVPDMLPKYHDYWRGYGIAPEDYKIGEIKGKKADKFIGMEAAAIKDNAPVGQSVVPDKVFIIENKSTGKRELIFMDEGDKKNPPNIIARVNEKQAASNWLKNEAKYKPEIYNNQALWLDNYMGDGGAAKVSGEMRGLKLTPDKAPKGFTEGVDERGVFYEKNGKKMYYYNGEWYE